MKARSASIIERAYLVPDQVENRSTPFELLVPLSVKSRISIKASEGFSTERLPKSLLQIEPRFAVGTNRWQLENGALPAQFECRQLSGRFAPGDYVGYRQTMAHLLAFLEQEIVFTTRPKPASSPP